MKKVFIPKGETVTYDSLNTVNIVVRGTLIVKGKLTAHSIQGGGRVEAEEIQCATIEVGTVQAEIVTAQKIVGKKLFIRDCVADIIMATDFIESLHVLTKCLYISLSSISQCDAEEIIMLTPKKRSLLGMLFASKMRQVAPAGKSRRHKKKSEVSCRDTENDLIKPEDTINEGETQTVAEIMEYLDKNGYLKARSNSFYRPDINVEYREEDAVFSANSSAKEAVGTAHEDVA